MKSIQSYRYVKEDINSGINQVIFEERSRHDGVEQNCNVENIDVNSYSGKLDCISSDIFVHYEKIKNMLQLKYEQTGGDGGIEPILNLLNNISDHWNTTDSNNNNETPDRQIKNIELFYRFIAVLNENQYEFLMHAPIDPYVNTFLEKETIRNYSGGAAASPELLEKIGKQIQELLNKKKGAEPIPIARNIDSIPSNPTTKITPVVGTVPSDNVENVVENKITESKPNVNVSDIKRFIIKIVDKDQLKTVKDLNDLNIFIQVYKSVLDTKYLDEENKSNLKKIITFILSNIEIEVTNNEMRTEPEAIAPLPVKGEEVLDEKGEEDGELIKGNLEKGELIQNKKIK
jgi:hypothetical protein